MKRNYLSLLSLVLVVVMLIGCTGGGGGNGTSVTKELENRIAQYQLAWNNLDRVGIKSFYGKNYAAHYTDQSETVQDLMDELGIRVLNHELMEDLLDLAVNEYRNWKDEFGVTAKFEYKDFKVVSHFDNIAQTSHLAISTFSSGNETIMVENRGLISWEKQGNSWRIVSESSLK